MSLELCKQTFKTIRALIQLYENNAVIEAGLNRDTLERSIFKLGTEIYPGVENVNDVIDLVNRGVEPNYEAIATTPSGRKENQTMPEIDNWGFNYENETMKGYVLYALKLMSKDYPELKLSEEQKKLLLNALNWATDDKTAQEAYEYYCKH